MTLRRIDTVEVETIEVKGTCRKPSLAARLVLCVIAGFLLAGTPQENLSRWLRSEAALLPAAEAPGETREERDVRIADIADSVAEAAIPHANGKGWTASELGLAVLLLLNEESRFDLRIHAGLPHPRWTQDDGKARCLGQLHTSNLIPPAVWSELAGTDPDRTRACARYATEVWVRQARQCGVWFGRRADRAAVAKTYAAYGSGGNCKPGDRDWARADKWQAAIGRRFDMSPIPGYRRAPLKGAPENVRDAAAGLVGFIGTPGYTPGTTHAVAGDETWKLRIEKHAGGKVGVSVYLRH